MTDSQSIKKESLKIFPPASLIFREGEYGECAYIIERGKVEILSLINGKETILAILGPGDLFGEMALVDAGVRTATARALGEVEVIVVSHDYVHKKLSKADPLISLLLQMILHRLRDWRKHLSIAQAKHSANDQDQVSDYENKRRYVQDTLRLNRDLQTALDFHQFDIYYQPIFCLKTHHLLGFEALVRWQHPERGLVPPNDFIWLAEETGLIVPLGASVMHEACAALQRFERDLEHDKADRDPLFISVNVSPRQVGDETFLQHLCSTLEETGIKPGQVKLEITESLLMESPKEAIKILKYVKTLGLMLAIDDFGTGYSSLSYLHRFPIDNLKIDRSFVMSMEKDERSLAIVRAITGLARALGLTIIAEGIESNSQLESLYAMGCEMGQGYLMAKPQSEDKIRDLLVQYGIGFWVKEE